MDESESVAQPTPGTSSGTDRVSNRPALGGTVPLWGKMSRVPRRPCAGRILSRFGQKSDVCDCATHMSHAECTIVHMSEHENSTGRYTTKDRARRATKHAYTCTNVHMTLFRCQNWTVSYVYSHSVLHIRLGTGMIPTTFHPAARERLTS